MGSKGLPGGGDMRAELSRQRRVSPAAVLTNAVSLDVVWMVPFTLFSAVRIVVAVPG